jgi:hypothetical protein
MQSQRVREERSRNWEGEKQNLREKEGFVVKKMLGEVVNRRRPERPMEIRRVREPILHDRRMGLKVRKRDMLFERENMGDTERERENPGETWRTRKPDPPTTRLRQTFRRLPVTKLTVFTGFSSENP